MKRKSIVSLNMAASIDGKVATSQRGPVKLGSAYDSRRMAEIRADHDVVVMGAGTFLAHPNTLKVGPKDLLQKRKRQKLSKQPATAIVSSQAKMPKVAPWLKDYAVERWLFCGQRASVNRLQKIMCDGVRVSQDFQDRPDPARILDVLRRHGHQRILLEGGGAMNAAFFEQDLVDRIYLTLCPILVGAKDAPTIFDGMGFGPDALSKWKISERKLKSGELYLVFDRHKNAWKKLPKA